MSLVDKDAMRKKLSAVGDKLKVYRKSQEAQRLADAITEVGAKGQVAKDAHQVHYIINSNHCSQKI